jgi:hypothetical protein
MFFKLNLILIDIKLKVTIFVQRISTRVPQELCELTDRYIKELNTFVWEAYPLIKRKK